jgi:hypothetical protein
MDVWVIIDYQNIHLTARDLFVGPRSPARQSQIHPLKFAVRIVALRSTRNKEPDDDPPVLRRVLVFRGQPRVDREARLYSTLRGSSRTGLETAASPSPTAR